MADFCKQCSTVTFGEDFGDFISEMPPMSEPQTDTVYIRFVLCEGCGYTVVDATGTCVGNCMKRHSEVTQGEVC